MLKTVAFVDLIDRAVVVTCVKIMGGDDTGQPRDSKLTSAKYIICINFRTMHCFYF